MGVQVPLRVIVSIGGPLVQAHRVRKGDVEESVVARREFLQHLREGIAARRRVTERRTRDAAVRGIVRLERAPTDSEDMPHSMPKVTATIRHWALLLISAILRTRVRRSPERQCRWTVAKVGGVVSINRT